MVLMFCGASGIHRESRFCCSRRAVKMLTELSAWKSARTIIFPNLLTPANWLRAFEPFCVEPKLQKRAENEQAMIKFLKSCGWVTLNWTPPLELFARMA